MPKSPDPLLQGKVKTNSVGFPEELWKAIDEEWEEGGWKSRSAFLTATVLEAINAARTMRKKQELAELQSKTRR